MKNKFTKCEFCGVDIFDREFIEIYINFYKPQGTLRTERCEVDNKRILVCKKCYEGRFSFI